MENLYTKKQLEWRKALFDYILNTPCFREDIIKGNITIDTFSKWGIRAESFVLQDQTVTFTIQFEEDVVENANLL